MVLRRLQVHRFGPFSEGEWSFGPGLNVVRGPNEAGKSHIREAIVRLLFDQTKVTSKAQDVSRWTSWGEDRDFALDGEFTVRDEAWRITKDFGTDAVLLAATDGSLQLHDDGPMNEHLHELLGVHTRDIYTTTACLEQQQFAHLAAGREVGELLQQTMTGGAAASSVRGIIDRLNREQGKLEVGLKGAYKTPGPIRAARDDIVRLRGEIDALSPEVAAAEDARARLDSERARLTALRDELERDQAVLEAADRRAALAARFEELQKQCLAAEAERRQARELIQQLDDLDRALAALPDLSDEQMESIRQLRREGLAAREQVAQLATRAETVREDVDGTTWAVAEAQVTTPPRDLLRKTTELSVRLTQLREDTEEERAQLGKLERERENALSGGVRARAVITMGLTLTVLGLATGYISSPPMYVIAAAGIGLVVVGLLARPRRSLIVVVNDLAATRSRLQAAETDAADADARLSEMLAEWDVEDTDALAVLMQHAEERLNQLRESKSAVAGRAQQVAEQIEQATEVAETLDAELAERLREAGFPDDWDSFAAACEQIIAHRADRRSAADRLEGLLRDRSLPDLERALSEANLARDAVQTKLESAEMQSAALEPGQHQELQRRVAHLTEETTELAQQIARLHRLADDPDADPDWLQSLGERLTATEGRLALLEERRDALQLAAELLDQANRETMSRAVEHLAPRMRELLAPLTGGHYTEVSIDEATLNPQVVCPEKGDLLDLEREASCATREQVFLAARLALTSLLWPDEMPPILLDDPLVNFDSARRAAALDLIRHFARQAQVIVFTCHDWYDEVADQLIELPARR